MSDPLTLSEFPARCAPPWAHLATVLVVVGSASLVPYAHPGLVDWRYWDRFDAAPLERALTLRAPDADETVALAQDVAPPLVAETMELAGAELDRLAGGPAVVRVPKPALAPPAGEGAESEAATLPGAATAANPLLVADDVLGDQSVWIEDPDATLGPLWRGFEELVRQRRSYVRIAHYGDSHAANDGITNVTRLLLQRRFGDGGHGFTLVQGRTQWYVHKGVQRSASDGWRLVNFLTGNAKDGAYGYGGVAADGGAGAAYTLGTAGTHTASRATLTWRSLGRATIAVALDGKPRKMVEISTPVGTDGSETWAFPDGKHTITWTVKAGRVRVFGAALERDRGVVYDSLGEVGARGTRWLNTGEAHLKAMLAQRPPDLVILNYGGNERLDKVSESKYLERMSRVVARLRSGRATTACLVLGPSDHGIRQRGQIVSDPAVLRIHGWQRTLARQSGCAFFDTLAFMGGEGAMGRWHKSGLGWADYSHFSPKGEQVMGVGMYRALMKGLRQWQATVAQ